MALLHKTRELIKSVRNSVYLEPLIQARIKRINDFHDFQSPFLITSAGSSGSHLLGILLDSHPNIGVGPELYLLNKKAIFKDYPYFQENIQNWLTNGLRTDGPEIEKRFFTKLEFYGWERRLLPFLAKDTTSIKEFLDVFFGYFLIKRGKTMWGDKLPADVNCIGEFLATYPKGKIIHLIRDGRDVVASFSKRKMAVTKAAEFWLYSNALALEWEKDDRLLFIKYEDFVTSPETTLEQVQKYLGVKVEDLDKLRESNSYWRRIIRSENENYNRHWRHNPLFSPISPSSIGEYTQYLSKDDLAVFYNYTASQSTCVFPPNSLQSVEAMSAYFGYKS